MIFRLHHTTHAWGCRSSWHFFLLFSDYTFCGQEHACDRSCIFQCHTSNLSWVDYASFKEVFVLVGACIVTKVALAVSNLVYHNCAFETSVVHNLAKWFFDGTLYDANTSSFIVVVALKAFERIQAANVSHATTRNDTFCHSCTSCAKSIVNTVFLLGAPM